MWHQDTKLPHIRKTHPYISARSFKTGEDTASSPIRDHRPDHMTRVEAVTSGLCVSFCREKHTQTSNSLLSELNQQRWPSSASYFLFFCIYWVLRFTLAIFFILLEPTRSESETHSCVLVRADSDVENSNATTRHVQAMIKTNQDQKKKNKTSRISCVHEPCRLTKDNGPHNNTQENSAFKPVHHCWC